jgi:hypothetical protein
MSNVLWGISQYAFSIVKVADFRVPRVMFYEGFHNMLSILW